MCRTILHIPIATTERGRTGRNEVVRPQCRGPEGSAILRQYWKKTENMYSGDVGITGNTYSTNWRMTENM